MIGAVLVVGDDFGWTPSINAGIRRAFEDGLLTHTSVMASMPAFDEACAIAEKIGFADRVGLHLVLSEGTPVTSAMSGCRRFCDPNGNFKSRKRVFRMSREERAIVAGEVRAQVGRAREGGFAVRHLDSHHHMHNELAILRVVLDLAAELGIERVRLAPNLGDRGLARAAYKASLNTLIQRAGLAGTTYAGTAHELVERAARRKGAGVPTSEIVMHPFLRADGQLRDAYGEDVPFDEIVRRAMRSAQMGSSRR